MTWSRARLAVIAIVVVGIAIATTYLLPEAAPAPHEVPGSEPSAAADTPASDRVTRLPVAEEVVAVPVSLEPTSWEAGFAPEQRAAVRDRAAKPDAALVLVEILGFHRSWFGDDIVYVRGRVLCNVPGHSFELGDVFDGYASTTSPFKPATLQDIRY